MSTLHRSLVSAALVALGASIAAQGPTYLWSPLNTGSVPGGNNNTIPFWSQSATYQQVHNADIMRGIMTLKGLAMRPAGSGSVKGRSWDMQITISHTSSTAITASTTFSANLGTIPTVVFGGGTTWPTFTWSDFTGSGTTPAFTIPFTTPYLYVPALGNLVWEWRHKNASSNANMAMDASQSTAEKGTVLTSVGTGCTASGNTTASTITLTPIQPQSGIYPSYLEIAIKNARANSAAMLALSLAQTAAPIGWCAPVINPALLVPVQADATGSVVVPAEIYKLSGTPPTNIYAQAGFADAGLMGGIGLTDIAGYRSPNIPGAHGVTRIWKATYQGATNGDELAVAGSFDRGYGLSVGWLQ